MPKKKKQSENVQNAYDAYASEVQSTGQDLVNGMTTAGQQQMAEMEAANNAYNKANQQAIEANRQQNQAAINSFADMVEGYARNIRNAEAESAAQVAADQRAARWTGLTEGMASLANLIAVGSGNAVSQQYRPYSQDWMRKADMDARMNRARIDNLRERQRAMQGQLANLRLNDAAKALELARADAKARHDQGLAMSQARYSTTINPLVQAAKNAEEVGKINTQGAAQVASTALHEQQIAQSAAQHAASLEQRRREHDAAMLAKGYNPDGTINEEAMGKLIAAEQASKKKGSGKNSGNSYDVTVDGKRYTIDMSDDTFKSALEFGNSDLKKDIARIAGVENWNALKKRTSGKKGDMLEYKEIVDAIEKGGEGSEEIIRRFISNNRDDLNEFNSHLVRVSNGGRITGVVNAGMPTAPADTTKTLSIDEEILGNK